MKTISHPIIFVRHGRTPWNELQRYQGATDTELSEIGIEEALQNVELLSAFLADETPAPNWSLFSSPLKRAQQTADILSNNIEGLPVPNVHSAFRELSLGRWEGMTSPEVKEVYYEERRSRKSGRWDFAPTGGESIEQRRKTLENALENLPSYSVVVTHCGILRALLHLLDGQPREDAMVADTPHVGLMVWDGEKISMRNA